MAALRKFTYRGLKIEMWKTSFRIEGMSSCVQVEYDITDGRVRELIDAIYRPVAEKAKKDGLRRASEHMAKVIMGAPTLNETQSTEHLT